MQRVIAAPLLDALPALAAGLGSRAWLLCGSHVQRSGRVDALVEALRAAGVRCAVQCASGEPDVHSVDHLAAELRNQVPNLVIAIGGGSVMDAAKAAALLARNPGTCEDYLEDLPAGAGGRAVQHDALPLIAVPTTAGTGSEATLNAVISVKRFALKRSLRHASLLPQVALLDATLLHSLPRAQAAACAADALGHLLESYLSTGATAASDAYSWPGLQHAWEFVQALAAGQPADFARMQQAALHGGQALAMARLGAAHGLVAAVGGVIAIGHAQGVAALTAAALRVNARALTLRMPQSAALGRLRQVAELVGAATADAAADRISAVYAACGLRGLDAYGWSDAMAAGVVAAPSGSIRTNPIRLEREELLEIVRLAR